MKRIIYFLITFISVAGMLLPSCKDDNDIDRADAYLWAEPRTPREIPANGGDASFTVKTNMEGWAYTLVNGDWLTEILKTNAALILSAEVNIGPARTATLKINSEKDSKFNQEISIIQAAGNISFTVDPQTPEEIAAEGGNINFTITTNVPNWTYSITNGDWLKETAKSSTSLTLTAKENTDTEVRTAILNFTSALYPSVNKEIIITQASSDPSVMVGSGTESDPFQIKTVAHLRALSEFVKNDPNNSTDYTKKNTYGVYYKLMNDITFIDKDLIYDWDGIPGNESNLWPIGGFNPDGKSNGNKSFGGVFDGNGKVISGLRIKKTVLNDDASHIGLFGRTRNATIKNLGITDAEVIGYQNVGILFGLVSGLNAAVNPGGIEGCYVTNSTVVSNLICAGGLGGYLNRQVINNCYSAGCTVTGKGLVGGLCGQVGAGSIGSISDGKVLNSYAANSVKGVCDPNLVNVANSNSDAAKDGGLFSGLYSRQRLNAVTVENCYYLDIWGNGVTNVDLRIANRTDNGTSKTAVEMKEAAFVNTLNGIQSTAPWKADSGANNGFPVLSWQ